MLTSAESSALRLSFQVAGSRRSQSAAGGRGGVSVGPLSLLGQMAVGTAVDFPLVLPPVVTGYLLLVASARMGRLAEFWPDGRRQDRVHLAGGGLASAVVSFPLMVRSIRLAFHGVDPRLRDGPRSLGASRAGAFFTVALPLARRGLVAGFVLAFGRSLGEFGATIMVAGNIQGRTRPSPWQSTRSSASPTGWPAPGGWWACRCCWLARRWW